MLQAVKNGWRFFVDVFAFRTGWEQEEAPLAAGECRFADAAVPCDVPAQAALAGEEVRAAS